MKKKMAYFERKILRKIYEPISVNEMLRKRTNRKVQKIYQKPGINAYETCRWCSGKDLKVIQRGKGSFSM